MSVKGKFRLAEKILNSFDSETIGELEYICLDIRRREKELLIQSADLMKSCAVSCGGICCRNIYLDAVINLWDCIFILASRPKLSHTIFQRLNEESLFFTSDCVFLKNGVGPCIFPSDIRPFTCITTFCADEAPIKDEIRRVRQEFRRMSRFVIKARIKYRISSLAAIFSRDQWT